MEVSGPSKEELENYFRNSRPYFDELAKHYKETDPQYYNEYIAPFYNNPFRMAVSSTQGTPASGARGIALITAMIAIAIAGVAVFLVLQLSNENSSDDNSDKSVNSKKEEVSRKVTTSPDTLRASSTDNYDKAMNYFRNRDLDNAEKYFKLVPRKDKNYPDAVRKLKMIEEMKLKSNNK